MNQKGLTHDGRVVDTTERGIAFLVDLDEPGTDKIIARKRAQWLKEHPEDAEEADVADEGQFVDMGGPAPAASAPADLLTPDTEEQKIIRAALGDQLANTLFAAGLTTREGLAKSTSQELVILRGIDPAVEKEIREWLKEQAPK